MVLKAFLAMNDHLLINFNPRDLSISASLGARVSLSFRAVRCYAGGKASRWRPGSVVLHRCWTNRMHDSE